MIPDDFTSIVIQCEGCDKVLIQPPLLEVPMIKICRAYINPESKWGNGRTCPLASHVQREEKKDTRHVDPIKASKKMMGKK